MSLENNKKLFVVTKICDIKKNPKERKKNIFNVQSNCENDNITKDISVHNSIEDPKNDIIEPQHDEQYQNIGNADYPQTLNNNKEPQINCKFIYIILFNLL